MALSKYERDFCGPSERTKRVLNDEETIACRSEVMRVIDVGSPHFLFTPNEQEPLVNGKPVQLPNLAKLFASFVPFGQSLVFAFKNVAEFAPLIEDLLEQRWPTYGEVLLRHSVRIVPCAETEYQLSGGSFAGVRLSLVDEQRWEISKMIRRDFGDVDADVRLLAEGKFISNLPPQAARLFPKVRPEDVIEENGKVGYRMEYCPFPTIAELVLAGHITPEQTVEFLAGIYDAMFTRVYCIPEDGGKKDDDYFSRIDRRMERVLATPDHVGQRLKTLLRAEELTIDGKKYPGFRSLYERLSQNDNYRKLVLPPDHCVAHGDMILEDILLQPYSAEFRLIDPNSRSHSRYYDLAKTFLSLATKYELFYFERFSLEYEKQDPTDINIVFDDPEMAETYDEMCENFWSFLEKHAGQFFKEEPEWKDRLMLLNGLQNLAIVMFHLIRHNREDRAIAFLLMGIKQLSSFFKAQNRNPVQP